MMPDDATQVELLLRDTLAASAAAAPSQAGAWQRFQGRRARRTLLVRAGAGLAFAAIVAAAVALPGLLQDRAGRSVAPATAPTGSSGVRNSSEVEPAGSILTVSSGVVAGRAWTFELYRSVGGQLCGRWGASGGGSCGLSDHTSWGANPWVGRTNTTGLGTSVSGVVPATAVRVRIEFRGRRAVEVGTRGGKEFAVSAYATVLPGRVIVTRITAYDAQGRVVSDDRHPYNTAWPKP
jgi:hypothetical protein